VQKILLAVDGSESALRATRKLIESVAAYKVPPRVELVTVHPPVPHYGGFSAAVVSHEMIEKYYREEGEKALAASKQVLDEAGVRYTPHVLVGEVPRAIVEHAGKARCQMIYMGTRGMTALVNMLLGSVATKVLHLARVPVVLVHG
jgi:nucleotide-binding universal stress UspA family protein